MSKSPTKKITNPEELMEDIDKLMGALNDLGNIEDIENFDSDSFARKINKLNEEMEKKYNTEDLDSDVEGCIDEETK